MYSELALAVTAAPIFVPAVEFSAMERVTPSPSVILLIESDQGPLPSSFWARTCTS